MFEDNSFEKNKICDLETKEYLRSNRSESEGKNAGKLKGMVFRLTTTTIQREGVRVKGSGKQLVGRNSFTCINVLVIEWSDGLELKQC